MENSRQQGSLVSFAYYLSENKLVDKQVGLEALKKATQNKTSFIEYLIKNRLINSVVAAKVTAEYYGLPLVDIESCARGLIPNEFYNIPLVKKRMALPLFIKGSYIYLAVVDPTLENLSEVKFLTGYEHRLMIAESGQLTREIDELLNTLIFSEMGGVEKKENAALNAYQDEEADFEAYDVESAPVINYLNKVLYDAIEKGASDIHFERYENDYRIRYRLYGVLYAITAPPLKLASFLLARIKIMSNLDITEHRIPQDGRFKMTISKSKAIDFRVSVCPALYGEKIVLRLLDASQIFHSVEKLGMEALQMNHLLKALERTQGMILVTGPTGSGKSVTLYSALNHLNTSEDNIMTVEDPVEIPLHGINQVHVNTKVGLTFSTALRSFLRQDPDIIMVGEIRDLETAEISVKAAQTGHLILSTLHTNSAPETVNRLVNMGVEAYNLASALILVVAQRLLRVLCNHCKKKDELPPDILLQEGFKKEEIGTFQLYKPGGCEHCIHGFIGRTGIFEVMPISREMALLIMRGGNAIEIENQAKQERVVTLREMGLSKVKQGVTTLTELNRIFN